MATPVSGEDDRSSTEQGPQISGPESETSVSRHVNFTLNAATPVPIYNPYVHMQQVGSQNYPSLQIADSHRLHYDLQGHVPSSTHEGSLYMTPAEMRRGYQEYHPPVEEQIQGYGRRQQQNNLQPAEGYVESDQSALETSHQEEQVLPRTSPNVRQRIRRRNRTNRARVSNNRTVTVDAANIREHSASTSITGSVTSGFVSQALVEIEGSQERLSRLTSTVTETEEPLGIGESFDCNICFQKANEAVVTCCGHLFCWPCLYRWLHVHSYHKECPVCKGSVAECSITPIYGRENALADARMQGGLGTETIPPRPVARRVESIRQQRDRERRVRELREAEAGERTNQEREQVSQIERIATEIEGELQARSVDVPNSEVTPRRREDHLQTGAEIVSRLQHVERDMNEWDRTENEPTGRPQISYRQRRLPLRQEQLRQTLVDSHSRSATHESPVVRGGERQQTLPINAPLSQEWEHLVTGSRLVVDPTEVAAWIALIHARLANTEENSERSNVAAQHRRQIIASAVSQLSQPQEVSISSLTVNPSQVSDWIATMRNQLNNIEQLLQNFEQPIEGIQRPQTTATFDVENLNTIQLDRTEDPNPNEFLAELNATVSPQGIISDSDQNPNVVESLNAARGRESNSERIIPETQSVRRHRRRMEHEEASQLVSQEGAETPNEDQLQLTRKRRRLD